MNIIKEIENREFEERFDDLIECQIEEEKINNVLLKIFLGDLNG